MGTLEIRVFGSLTLERDSKPLDKFPSRRVRDLLGYLVVNRERVHNREYLAGLFWGELDDRRARHCLNTALWRLHRILAEGGERRASCLLVDSQSLGFDSESDVRVDLNEFERFCQWAEQVGTADRVRQAQLYRRSVQLYGGDLLPDCYDDWCLIERERTHTLYLRSLSQLLGYHVGKAEFGLAADYANRILMKDPLREEVHRDLIDIYLANNQPALALQQYRKCEQILDRELGIEPMEETQSRLRKVLQHTRISNSAADNWDRLTHTSYGLNEGAQDLQSSLRRLKDRVEEFDEAYANLKSAIDELESSVGTSDNCDPESERIDREITAPAARMHAAAQRLDGLMRSAGVNGR